jgi:hypothetical protein
VGNDRFAVVRQTPNPSRIAKEIDTTVKVIDIEAIQVIARRETPKLEFPERIPHTQEESLERACRPILMDYPPIWPGLYRLPRFLFSPNPDALEPGRVEYLFVQTDIFRKPAAMFVQG